MQPIRRLFTTALVLAACTVAAANPAQTAQWADKRFVYRAEGKKLADVFQDFAASVSVPVVVDTGVDGTVNASFDNTGESFLKAMGRTYGVIWYFDGVTLFVYPSRAMQSRVFRLRGFDRHQVRDMLGSFGLGDTRFPLRYNETEQTVFAYGPPRHIELVATAIETLEQGSRERSGNAIRVVPLKYAVAADRVSGSTRVTGLASTLNSIFGGGAAAAGTEAVASAREAAGNVLGTADKRRTVEQTYGFKPQAPAEGSGARKPEARSDKPAAAAAGGDDRPYFQADEASNAIIINAAPARMQQHEALVRQLDLAQDLVEIEATIIDVSTDEFESLGVDWDYTRNGRGSVSVAPGALPMVGANITTLVANAGERLLSRIRALEGSGKARIVARPKVLGASNRTAMMTDKRIASVKVAGNLDANLFTIEAGTTLQVQPQIVPYADRREVKLTLYIEDGNFESTGVDQVPIIKRTEIRTEASIREGESLLVGGISVETDTSSRSGVTGLSRIPLLGALFRNDEGSKRRSERLFLITPKVINVEGARAVVAAAPAAAPAGAVTAAAAALPAARPVVAAAPECAAAALGLPDARCASASPAAR